MKNYSEPNRESEQRCTSIGIGVLGGGGGKKFNSEEM